MLITYTKIKIDIVGNVLYLKFDNRWIHSDIKSKTHGLVLLNINLLCCAWVRERRQMVCWHTLKKNSGLPIAE